MGRDQLRSSRNILQRFTNVFGLVFSIQLLITLHRVEGNLLAGSWAYDPGTSVRSEGHPGLTVDGNNATCYITKVYNNPWVRIEIGNKDGKTHGKLFVVNQVQIVKCQGQKCADNSPDIYVSNSTDVTKLTDTEKCGSYDSSTITCTSPLVGSNIFLRVTGNTSLGVCGVIANRYQECTNRRYGSGCGIPCNCQSQCHPVTGVCTGSCDAGWTKNSKGICSIQDCTNRRYGSGCGIPCNCQSQCHSVTGVCTGSCDAGWTKDSKGICSIQACTNDRYGPGCNTPCNCKSQCDSSSGVCSVSCDAGKMKDNAGVCSVTCNNNHYGEDCRKPCNCESQCDAVSGFCSRSCVAGKMKDNAGVCSVTCNNGGYGVDCNTPCHCTSQCGHESGLCVDSCDSGWLKSTSGVCNIKNCTNGNYGPGCAAPCHCSSQCHVTSGVCSDACVAGWMKNGTGVCTVTCTGGNYGVDCESLCHCKPQCDVANGKCDGQCDAEWKKDQNNVCSIAIMPLLEVAQTSNTMTFKWNTTASVSEYLVQYREKGVDEWQNMTSTNSDDDLIIANLTHNTEYEVRVVSQTRPNHRIGSFKTACKHPLPPKITMLDSSIEGNLAQVSFKLGATDPQCDNIKMIKVNYSDGDDWKIKEFPNPSSQQLQKMTVSGLKPGITYQIVVIVINNENMETQSKTSSMKTKTKPVDSRANEQMEEQTLIIIIVVVAVLAALIIILFLVFIWCRLRKKKQAVVLLEKKEKRISRAYEMDAVVMDGPYNDNDSAYMVSIADEVPVVNAQAPVAVVAPHIEEAHDNNAANNVEVKPEMAVVDEENVLPTEPIYGNINDSNISHMLKVTELAAYIEAEEKLEEPFKEEFKQIPSGLMAVCDVGQRPENRPKNRFTNIWPYDHRRVVLSQIGDNVNTDYINACYVDGYKKSNTYIASQAPKKITINDMWRMIWEINCKRIVMVTRAMEGGKVKCEDYWPEHGPDTYGDITVQPVNTKEFADYTIRIFNVSKSGETRNIIHFCFTSWPDHNVPSSTSPLLTFHRKIRSYDASHDGIMLIHCSAGVGRTGAFIALDYLLEQGAKEGQVDVYSCVQLMRTQRVNMIQTVAQYKFVYTCLRDAFMSGETCCSSNDFRDYYSRLLQTEEGSGKSKMEAQFEALQCLIPKLSSFDFSSAMDQENSEKNRSQDILPDNFNRPFLITHVSGRNNYINAVFANSFQKKNGFIVTQMPLTETKIDFWRMIYDHNVRTIVMLNSLGEDDKDNGRYWPNDRQTRTYEPFKITVGKTEHPLEDIAVRTIKLMNSQKANDETRAIKQFQLTSWSDTSDIPQDKVSVQLLTEQVEAWHSVTSGPILVHDLFGASKCGVFCVVSSARERIRVDQEVDIFMTARQVCQARPQLMDKLEQYTFCHEIIGSYLSQFDVYENFQPMTKL